MPEKPIHRRIPVRRRIKPPHPSHSTHGLHREVVARRSSNKQSKVINRCNSEPALLTSGISVAGDGVDMTPPGDSCLLFRNRISTDVFSSSPELLPNSPEKAEGYNKDAKVVIKVTVEGSVGPIRALVKLSSSIDETIKLVMNKYIAERRVPQLGQHDLTSFELHHSYFSLQCLDKSNMIGETGSRSFYMRKRVNNNADMGSNTIVVAEADDLPSSFSNIFLAGFIHQEFENFIKRTTKIRRWLGCFGG